MMNPNIRVIGGEAHVYVMSAQDIYDLVHLINGVYIINGMRQKVYSLTVSFFDNDNEDLKTIMSEYIPQLRLEEFAVYTLPSHSEMWIPNFLNAVTRNGNLPLRIRGLSDHGYSVLASKLNANVISMRSLTIEYASAFAVTTIIKNVCHNNTLRDLAFIGHSTIVDDLVVPSLISMIRENTTLTRFDAPIEITDNSVSSFASALKANHTLKSLGLLYHVTNYTPLYNAVRDNDTLEAMSGMPTGTISEYLQRNANNNRLKGMTLYQRLWNMITPEEGAIARSMNYHPPAAF